MPNDMYMMRDDGVPLKLEQSLFQSELDFQTLLAAHPQLLAGEKINEADPRRWLLVRCEAAIGSEPGGPSRWAVDHLFIDQDGIPTLVEVKRQTDSRIRREVVGQMLDYAANGVVYWPVQQLRAQFEARCEKEDIDSLRCLSELIGTDADPEQFWRTVDTNLRAGRIRMLFVADVLPPELRRVVEFLNQQMSPAEVLALELRRYEGNGLAALVPTIHGHTEAAISRKSVEASPRWSEESFLAKLALRPEVEFTTGTTLLAWIKEIGTPVWGSGKQDGSVSASCVLDGKATTIISVYTSGAIDLSFLRHENRTGPTAAIAQEWRTRLNGIAGLSPSPGKTSVNLDRLSRDGVLTSFVDSLAWLQGQLRDRRRHF